MKAHRSIDKGLLHWDEFLKFGKNELNINELPMDNLKIIKLFDTCDSFRSIDINHIKNKINNASNTLFILCNNNRIHTNELFYYNKIMYNVIKQSLNDKTSHLIDKFDAQKNIAIHIRRGDWSPDPILYIINVILIINSANLHDYNINIFSAGTVKQMNEIISNVKNLNDNIKFYLNHDTFETIKYIYNADIAICGYSSFCKTVTAMSGGTIIYLPFNDEITKPLKNNTLPFHHGTALEVYDINRIETDIQCMKNRNRIIDTLNKFNLKL